MAGIPDDTKVVHLNVPGTHDTSTCMPISSFSTFSIFPPCLALALTNTSIYKQGTTQTKHKPLSRNTRAPSILLMYSVVNKTRYYNLSTTE